MTDDEGTTEATRREKLETVRRMLTFRPWFTLAIVCFGFVTALLEGVGLSFLLPIVEIAQSGTNPENTDGVLGLFVQAYQLIGVPMTLEWVLLGVVGVMTARYTASFGLAWVREMLRRSYAGSLRIRGLNAVLDARVSYFDTHGSDEVLNAIITQTDAASKTIRFLVRGFQQVLLAVMYLAIALYFAPVLTLIAVTALGATVGILRYVVKPAFVVGDRVARINEEIQTDAQESVQGVRAVKLFGITDAFERRLETLVDRYVESKVTLRRNEAAVLNFQQLMSAVVIFGLIYGAIRFTGLALTGLAVFLFAMFRLGPLVSSISRSVYEFEGYLPHAVRTERFIDELAAASEDDTGTRPAPERIDSLRFDDVSFTYADERVLEDVSFDVDRGEFVAIVGPSGAGKSTIVSLLSRLYEPDDGTIAANGTPIGEFRLAEWRDRLAVVRQNPYLFNDTLRYNLTLGEDASRDELDEACDVAGVREFFDGLPDGYDTRLGEDGVQLSGGQRQRVVLARALLRDFEVLVLDEATSDLDTTTEMKVHEALREGSLDATVVMITHRLSTVESADRIYTVEDGQITEAGDHDELLGRDGTYAELYTAG